MKEQGLDKEIYVIFLYDLVSLFTFVMYVDGQFVRRADICTEGILNLLKVT